MRIAYVTSKKPYKHTSLLKQFFLHSYDAVFICDCEYSVIRNYMDPKAHKVQVFDIFI